MRVRTTSITTSANTRASVHSRTLLFLGLASAEPEGPAADFPFEPARRRFRSSLRWLALIASVLAKATFSLFVGGDERASTNQDGPRDALREVASAVEAGPVPEPAQFIEVVVNVRLFGRLLVELALQGIAQRR